MPLPVPLLLAVASGLMPLSRVAEEEAVDDEKIVAAILLILLQQVPLLKVMREDDVKVGGGSLRLG